MRAVCTRSGRRGWVYAHTRGLCRSEGVELSVSLSLSFFLHATTERIHPRAKKLYYFGGKILFDPPPILLLSRFASFFFFFKPTTLFSGPPPHRKGVETTGERNRSSFAEILSQTRYYFSLLSCVHFAQFCCNCARCEAD